MNIFSSVPESMEKEIFEDLLKNDSVRIERIISKGQSSPEFGWYDQEENEWVIVLEGAGIISYEDGREEKLCKGDFLNIPAHTKHKVKWTAPDTTTIWLAVFYKN
jgi:cupin 2 domain-containing protein